MRTVLWTTDGQETSSDYIPDQEALESWESDDVLDRRPTTIDELFDKVTQLILYTLRDERTGHVTLTVHGEDRVFLARQVVGFSLRRDSE